MSKKRISYSSSFKAQVALAAIRQEKPIFEKKAKKSQNF
jgi:hypothetical protein